jgi:hypothetical protein
MRLILLLALALPCWAETEIVSTPDTVVYEGSTGTSWIWSVTRNHNTIARTTSFPTPDMIVTTYDGSHFECPLCRVDSLTSPRVQTSEAVVLCECDEHFPAVDYYDALGNLHKTNEQTVHVKYLRCSRGHVVKFVIGTLPPIEEWELVNGQRMHYVGHGVWEGE